MLVLLSVAEMTPASSSASSGSTSSSRSHLSRIHKPSSIVIIVFSFVLFVTVTVAPQGESNRNRNLHDSSLAVQLESTSHQSHSFKSSSFHPASAASVSSFSFSDPPSPSSRPPPPPVSVRRPPPPPPSAPPPFRDSFEPFEQHRDEEDEDSASVAASSTDSSTDSSSRRLSPLLIRSATIRLVFTTSGNMSLFISHLESALVPSIHAYISSSHIDSHYSRIEIRVPSSSFDTFLHSIPSSLESPISIGRLVSQTLASEDVTEAYTDTESRIKNLIVVKEQYEVIMKKANAIADILAIQDHLRKVTEELEVFKGKIASMKSKIQFSSVLIDCQVEEPPRPPYVPPFHEPPPPPRFYEDIFDPTSVFLSSLRAVLIFLALFLHVLIQVVVFGIPFAGLAWVMWKVGKRVAEMKGVQAACRWLNNELGVGNEKIQEKNTV